LKILIHYLHMVLFLDFQMKLKGTNNILFMSQLFKVGLTYVVMSFPCLCTNIYILCGFSRLHMVELRKTGGDTLEFNSVCFQMMFFTVFIAIHDTFSMNHLFGTFLNN
jgi:hypothetical protein